MLKRTKYLKNTFCVHILPYKLTQNISPPALLLLKSAITVETVTSNFKRMASFAMSAAHQVLRSLKFGRHMPLRRVCLPDLILSGAGIAFHFLKKENNAVKVKRQRETLLIAINGINIFISKNISSKSSKNLMSIWRKNR